MDYFSKHFQYINKKIHEATKNCSTSMVNHGKKLKCDIYNIYIVRKNVVTPHPDSIGSEDMDLGSKRPKWPKERIFFKNFMF
jgi:hypothetical protein